VLGCCNSQIQSWDIESGRLTDWYLGHNKEVHAVQVSNKIILSASGDYSVKLWDSDTQKCTQTFHEHTGSVMTLQVIHFFMQIWSNY
jgi:WD40 repeat protein